VDRGCDVIGELPGTKGTGKGNNDVKWVLKTLVEQIDNNYDFNSLVHDKQRLTHTLNSTL
jgi:hypothetical protein